MFRMTDEAGGDDKVLCVPATDPRLEHLRDINHVPKFDRLEIQHFFEVYKDLEPGKSVEGAEWVGRTEAEAEVEALLPAVQGQQGEDAVPPCPPPPPDRDSGACRQTARRAAGAQTAPARAASPGDAERVDQVAASGRSLRHRPLIRRLIALDRAAGEPAVLHEPGPVRLDAAQRVQVAEQLERDLEVAVLEPAPCRRTPPAPAARRARGPPRSRGPGHREKTSPGFISSSMPRLSRRATPASMCSSRKRSIAELVVAVEQAGLLVPLVAAGQHVADPLDQLVHAGPLDHGLDRQAGDEADHAELVQVLEVAGVVGQQALGDQLQQDVLSPSKVVNTSVSAFSAANRLTDR